MRLTYDPKYNIGYIAFREKTGGVQTIHISEELNVDLAPDGTIYGIELLNANKQLAENDLWRLFIQNENTGESTEIALPA